MGAGYDMGVTESMTVYFGSPDRNTEDPLISIVVPALNEALNLSVVLPQLPRVHEVILVDGGSVDGTVMAARRALPDIVTVLQGRKGKGNALAAGFARVTGDIVVMFDADGSADPAEITRFVEALKAGADFAKGSRFTAGGGSADITTIRSLGNRFLNGVFNFGFRTRYSDLCYGYNAFWADLIPLLDLPDHSAPAPGQRQDAVGRRVRDRDGHQLPLRRRQGRDHRGALGGEAAHVRRVQPPRRPGRRSGCSRRWSPSGAAPGRCAGWSASWPSRRSPSRSRARPRRRLTADRRPPDPRSPRN